MQTSIASQNIGRPHAEWLCLRAGAHTADVILADGDIYGAGVNLAARLATLAQAGEIVVSSEVRDGLVPGLDAEIEDLGECDLKHIAAPVRAYRVGPAALAMAGGAPADRTDLRPTLAVIPFDPLGSGTDGGVFGHAMAEEVIAALSKSSDLNVISRLSTAALQGRQKDSQQLLAHLGAHYVLSGSMLLDGDRFRVAVELADTQSSRVLWSEVLRGGVRATLGGDDAVIDTIAGAVSQAVITREVERASTRPLPTLRSYTLLLGATAHMHRTTVADFERAHEMLCHLIERSRRHPVPHAWLAKWHVLKVQQGWSSDLKREAQLALDATQRALDIAPDCSLALTMDGFARCNLLRDFDTAAERYRLALQYNPNESLAWLLTGMLHGFKGEGVPALDACEHAVALSPLDPLRYFFDSLTASAAISAGQPARAVELAQRSLRANRTHTSTYRALAIGLAQLGRLEEARSAVNSLIALEPSFTVSGFLARTPGGAFHISRVLAEALRAAGVPD